MKRIEAKQEENALYYTIDVRRITISQKNYFKLLCLCAYVRTYVCGFLIVLLSWHSYVNTFTDCYTLVQCSRFVQMCVKALSWFHICRFISQSYFSVYAKRKSS